ncbi:hypothetical protein ARC78_12445 [Stenotrophomonas pictorum JCM 9942]|uniref:Uncharacterized protein n=1 Tax=Stenotrophomonas pictorum JCM 9942 TaxID=1236960 RepID=A0A0R0A634_9GAMM|nr:hypothetical protein [Stenotrophomonas pictorum]KRG40635.1 hypothetical protein ARC78_12445 [Stenotrophomonas pictorum JCM 9942]
MRIEQPVACDGLFAFWGKCAADMPADHSGVVPDLLNWCLHTRQYRRVAMFALMMPGFDLSGG